MAGPNQTRVLFVCIGNSCRSPMAEAVARQIASDVMEVASAGLAPLGFVAELTLRTLVANGYTEAGLSSKPITPDVWDHADLVINMSGRPREMAFRRFAKVEDWDVEDPYGEDAEAYQKTFEQIQERVSELAERLRVQKAPAAGV